MFDKSYFETLQDYLASGCTMELTDEELDYYNVLYALVGINRKYGKDNAVAFLMHEPFNVERMRARQMYSEAINLFYLCDTIENDAHRNMMYDNLMRRPRWYFRTPPAPKIWRCTAISRYKRQESSSWISPTR